MSTDIPMKIMFENTPSDHLTVYRGKIRQPECAKNEECFASF